MKNTSNSVLAGLGCGVVLVVVVAAVALVGAIWGLEAWLVQWTVGEAFDYDMSFKGAFGITALIHLLFGGASRAASST